MRAIGQRVGAIYSADEKTVRFLGYGVYQGDEIPPPGITFLGIDLHAMKHENPKILLDNGDVVWGCECWWGAEGQTQRELEGREIITVSIHELRAKKD